MYIIVQARPHAALRHEPVIQIVEGNQYPGVRPGSRASVRAASPSGLGGAGDG